MTQINFEFDFCRSDILGPELISSFSSGQRAQDEFFHNHRSKLSEAYFVVYCLHEKVSNTIAGYFSLSSFAIDDKKIPDKHKNGMLSLEHIPGVLVGQLARNQEYKGRKFGDRSMGRLLYMNIVRKIFEIRQDLGVRFLFLHSAYREIDEIYRSWGFTEVPKQGASRRNRLFFIDLNKIDQVTTKKWLNAELHEVKFYLRFIASPRNPSVM